MENQSSHLLRRAGTNIKRVPDTTSPSVHSQSSVSNIASLIHCPEPESELSKHQPITYTTIASPTSPSQAVRHQHSTFRTSHHNTEHSRLTGTRSSSSIELYTTEHGVVLSPTRDLHNAFHKTQQDTDTDTRQLLPNVADCNAGPRQVRNGDHPAASQPARQPAHWSVYQPTIGGELGEGLVRAATAQQRGATRPCLSLAPVRL